MKFKHLRELKLPEYWKKHALVVVKTPSQVKALRLVASNPTAAKWVVELSAQGAEFEVRYGTRGKAYHRTAQYGWIHRVPAYSHRVYCGNARVPDEFLIPIPMEGRVWTDDNRSLSEGAWDKAASAWLNAECSPMWARGLDDEELEVTLRNDSEEYFAYLEIMPPEARANFVIRLNYLRDEYDRRRQK